MLLERFNYSFLYSLVIPSAWGSEKCMLANASFPKPLMNVHQANNNKSSRSQAYGRSGVLSLCSALLMCDTTRMTHLPSRTKRVLRGAHECLMKRGQRNHPDHMSHLPHRMCSHNRCLNPVHVVLFSKSVTRTSYWPIKS